MSTVEDYNGLCGLIAPFSRSELQIRCKYTMGHYGPCSFEKLRHNFYFFIGATRLPDPEEEFINSVLSHSKFDHNEVLITSDDQIIIRK